MLLLAIQVLDRKAIQAERLEPVHPSADGLEGNLQQLGVEPRLRLLPAGEQDLHLLTPRVDRVVPLVLVVAQRREIPDAVGELAEILRQLECLEELLRT